MILLPLKEKEKKKGKKEQEKEKGKKGKEKEEREDGRQGNRDRVRVIHRRCQCHPAKVAS